MPKRSPPDLLKPPGTLISDEPRVSICINQHWLPVLHAMIAHFQYPKHWSGTLQESRDTREQVRQLMVLLQLAEECSDMSICCVPPETNVLVQINADFSISISDDGGATWTPSKTDPRYGTPQAPAPGAGADLCQCAEGYIVGMQEYVEFVRVAMGHVSTLAEFLIECIEGALEVIFILLDIPTVGATALVGLIGMIMKQWYGEPAADWEALWTEEVYNAIRCIIYCNLEPNGQFNQNGYDNAAAQFLNGSIAGGTDPKGAAINAQQMFKFWQLKGVNTMIAANRKPTTFDCTACDCETSCGDDWLIWSDGSETDRGVWDAGSTILGGTVAVGGARWIEYASAAPDVTPPNAAVTIKSPTPTNCCSIYWEALTGSIGNTAFVHCGDAQDPGNLSFEFLQGTLANAIELAATAPFTVRVTFLSP